MDVDVTKLMRTVVNLLSSVDVVSGAQNKTCADTRLGSSLLRALPAIAVSTITIRVSSPAAVASGAPPRISAPTRNDLIFLGTTTIVIAERTQPTAARALDQQTVDSVRDRLISVLSQTSPANVSGFTRRRTATCPINLAVDGAPIPRRALLFLSFPHQALPTIQCARATPSTNLFVPRSPLRVAVGVNGLALH